LKRFVRAAWIAREPDVVAKEARALELVAPLDVPSQEVVAVDATGAECDVPALLLSRLPGRVVLEPADPGTWLERMAEPLPAIHAAPDSVRLAVQPYRSYADLQALDVPGWTKEPQAWKRAIDAATGPAPAASDCFVHRDYHPTNLLWSRGVLCGVLDWTNASHGDPAVDLGHCRLNLAQFRGVQDAERFAAAYRQRTGSGPAHPYWDLLTLVEILPEPDVYRGWTQLGLGGLSVALLRARLDEYVALVVSRL
jgi:aminoglycoside phosphotransferase (APT) family kinase protein